MYKKQLLYILLGVAAIVVLPLYYYFNPSSYDFFPKCPIYSVTGFHCPGCGSQRALYDFAHGNILEGISHNLLILIFGIVLLYNMVINIIGIVKGKETESLLHHPRTPMVIFWCILAFWVFRNVALFPFNMLAP
ncbi:DUF2752 domain-containing protein [Leptobacterium sp. I13]|uniref:DUF2752 domain-containing protein n=1 Tax=Leptobacterium meishanense TaxID=3128904 RepID=UPI0030EB8368